jgi:hypothetical protein
VRHFGLGLRCGFHSVDGRGRWLARSDRSAFRTSEPAFSFAAVLASTREAKGTKGEPGEAHRGKHPEDEHRQDDRHGLRVGPSQCDVAPAVQPLQHKVVRNEQDQHDRNEERSVMRRSKRIGRRAGQRNSIVGVVRFELRYSDHQKADE